MPVIVLRICSTRGVQHDGSLSVLRTPVKTDPLVVFCSVCLVLARVEDGGPQSGSRWSARSAARTNDLETEEDPPHTRSARDRQKGCGSSHLLPPVRKHGSGDAWRVPAPSLIWVHGRISGDMMMDGVSGVRTVKMRSLNLSRKSTQQRGGDRILTGADRRHQLINGHGRRATHHLGGCLLAVGDRQRQGGIAERTQGVIAAPQNFAFHRQSRVLAVMAVVLGR
jgi:hypothetical protein